MLSFLATGEFQKGFGRKVLEGRSLIRGAVGSRVEQTYAGRFAGALWNPLPSQKVDSPCLRFQTPIRPASSVDLRGRIPHTSEFPLHSQKVEPPCPRNQSTLLATASMRNQSALLGPARARPLGAACAGPPQKSEMSATQTLPLPLMCANKDHMDRNLSQPPQSKSSQILDGPPARGSCDLGHVPAPGLFPDAR
jgi:hypothetical protein